MVLTRGKRFNPLVPGYIIILIFLALVGYWLEGYKLRSNDLMVFSSPYAPVYYEMPQMEISMAGAGGHASLMRISLSLQIQRRNLSRIDDFAPRLTDRIISYMRKQNIEDVRKSTSAYWLHDGLLHAINEVTNPIPIQDLVFKEFVVQ